MNFVKPEQQLTLESTGIESVVQGIVGLCLRNTLPSKQSHNHLRGNLDFRLSLLFHKQAIEPVPWKTRRVRGREKEIACEKAFVSFVFNIKFAITQNQLYVNMALTVNLDWLSTWQAENKCLYSNCNWRILRSLKDCPRFYVAKLINVTVLQ